LIDSFHFAQDKNPKVPTDCNNRQNANRDKIMGLSGYKKQQQQQQHASSKCMLAFFLSSSCFFPLFLSYVLWWQDCVGSGKNVNLCLAR